MKIKIRDLTLGGIILAIYIIVCCYSSTDSRTVQLVLDIIRITIVALYVYNSTTKASIVFTLACILLSFLFIPLNNAVIFSVSSAISGLVLGIVFRNQRISVCVITAIIANIISFVYEMVISQFFYGTNIFSAYTSGLKKLCETYLNDIDFVSRYIIPNMTGIGIVVVLVDLSATAVIIMLIARCIVFKVTHNINRDKK